jgi:hypothetical protein
MIALRTVAPVSLPNGCALTATALFSLRSVRFAQLVSTGTSAAHASVPASMRRMSPPESEPEFCFSWKDRSKTGHDGIGP